MTNMKKFIILLLITGCNLPEPYLAYCNDAAVIEWKCFDDAGTPTCCPADKDANGP